jgi:hypothetical protein
MQTRTQLPSPAGHKTKHLIKHQAVDKDTLLQLRGCAAKGFAFDRRFGPEATSGDIYDGCVAGLVDGLFKVRALFL